MAKKSNTKVAAAADNKAKPQVAAVNDKAKAEAP